MQNRRTFLRTLAGPTAASLLGFKTMPQPMYAQTQGLRQKAAAKNMFFGAASSGARIRTDEAYKQAIMRECGIITPEYEMKWDRLRPTATTYNFTDTDYIVNFARQNGILLHGHTLCWHRALPAWFASTVNRNNAERLLREHIQTVAGRYRGQMHSWDVVNEVIEPADNTPNKLRNSLWFQALGENYIDVAFRACAEADPSALLLYNEYGVEFDDNARKDAILGLLRRLIARKVPIGGLGIQGHIRSADRAKFQANMNGFRTFLNDVAALGLKIVVTEFDCDDRSLPASTADRDAGVAQMYGDYCSVVMNNPAVIGFITWGLSDKYTELNASAPRPDNQPQRPLPLDSAMTRKSAWYSLEWWFDNTQARPRVISSVQGKERQFAAQAIITDIRCTPNPASVQASVSFFAQRSTNILLEIRDSLGNLIIKLTEGEISPGVHQYSWHSEAVANGLYWCVIRTSEGESAIPVVIHH